MAGHGQMRRYSPVALVWDDGHPQVWVANGTHASYATSVECTNIETNQKKSLAKGLVVKDTPTDGCVPPAQARKWVSWQGGGVVNVGEIGKPLNGQIFILSNVKWGEHGTGPEAEKRTGPTGPTFGRPWTVDDKALYIPVHGPGPDETEVPPPHPDDVCKPPVDGCLSGMQWNQAFCECQGTANNVSCDPNRQRQVGGVCEDI
jgi:hypothetical protein